MAQTIVHLKDVGKVFPGAGRPALTDISAPVQAGVITGLVGPDGAGKTTLMRLMAGLLAPSAGSIEVNGLDPVGKAAELREFIAYMPQKFGLYEDLSVQENLELHADLRGVVGPERQSGFQAAVGLRRPRPLRGAAGGQTLGRHETEIRPGLRAARTAPAAAAGRAGVGVDPIRAGNCGTWSMNWWGRG